MFKIYKGTFVTLIAIIGIYLFTFDVSANRDGVYCRGSQGYAYAVATDYSCTSKGWPGDPYCKYTGQHYPGSPKACSAGQTVSIHHFTITCPTCTPPCSPRWSGWSACSATCGTGTQYRRQSCTGAVQRQNCNTHPCPEAGACGAEYDEATECPTIDNVLSSSTSGLCATGVFAGFTGSGTDGSPWRWACNGQYGSTVNKNCCAKIAKGSCIGTGTAEFAYPTNTWPTGFAFCNPTSAVSTPNPVSFPTLTGTNPTTTESTWTCNTLNGTNGNTCRATLAPPTVSCGTASGTAVTNVKPASNLCLTTGGSASVAPSVIFNAQGNWAWGCAHSVFSGIVANNCSAPSCLAQNPLSIQNNVYFDANGDPKNAKVTLNCPGRNICCSIDGQSIKVGGEQKNQICTGESGEVSVNGNGATYTAKCWFKDGDGDGDGIKIPKGPFSVGTICTARSCTAQGTCQTTPVQASSASDSQCASTCSSNADCSRGRMIETRP